MDGLSLNCHPTENCEVSLDPLSLHVTDNGHWASWQNGPIAPPLPSGPKLDNAGLAQNPMFIDSAPSALP